MDNIKENINLIYQNINDICQKINKNPEDITVIAASKTVDAKRLTSLKQLGINICGENRVQELLEKYDKVDTEWHFIGRLQTNKVKYLTDKITLLHSLDRENLAKEIEKQYSKQNKILKALIEINIGGELSKGGIEPEKAISFYNIIKEKYPHISICGLMAVMPQYTVKPQKKYYLQMKDIYDKIQSKEDKNFKYLSMGMSNDYITAIKYGANMVRLGRVLFGERHYN